MHAIPGLAILLLATIGAARVVKVSLNAIRSAVRYVRDVHREVTRRCAVPAHVVQVDRDAIVSDVMARLVEYRGGAVGVGAPRVSEAPLACDTMVDVPRGRTVRA